MHIFFLAVLVASPPNSVPGGESPNYWSKLTLADLNALHETIREDHPGAIDQENKAFRQWMERGYQQAMAMAAKVDSADGLIFTLQFYASGFKDGHLTYRNYFQRTRIHWPGFIVALRGKKYVVHHVKEGTEGLPALGDELLSCDGKTPKEMMVSEIMPFYYGIESLDSSWVKKAPLLLIKDGNPFRKAPKSCTFQTATGRKTFDLHWRMTERGEIQAAMERAAFGKRGTYGIRHIDSDRVWVSVPSNGPKTPEDIASLKAIVDAMPGFRQKKLVIIDVRGNSGGNSRWGNLITEGLFGENYLNYLESLKPAKNTYVDWRVSKGNRAHINEILKAVAERFGKQSDTYGHFEAVGQGMEMALQKGEPFFHLPPEEQSRRAVEAQSAFKGQAIFLTDGKCGSACLDFADTILQVPGVIFAGFPTSADTVYMEVRGKTLPSKMGRLGFAVKVYRNRARGNNQPYIPKYRFDGDLWDTESVQAWLLALVANERRP